MVKLPGLEPEGQLNRVQIRTPGPVGARAVDPTGGGAIARGLGAVSSGLGQAGNALYIRANELATAEAQDAMNRFELELQNRLYQPVDADNPGGYFNAAKGHVAGQKREGELNWIDSTRDKYLEGLSEEAQQRFVALSNTRMMDYREAIDRYASQQEEAYIVSAYTGMLANDVNGAFFALSQGDLEGVQARIGNISASIIAEGRRRGMSSGDVAAMQRENISPILSGAIAQSVGNNELSEASAIFNSRQMEMTGADRFNAAKLINEAIDDTFDQALFKQDAARINRQDPGPDPEALPYVGRSIVGAGSGAIYTPVASGGAGAFIGGYAKVAESTNPDDAKRYTARPMRDGQAISSAYGAYQITRATWRSAREADPSLPGYDDMVRLSESANESERTRGWRAQDNAKNVIAEEKAQTLRGRLGRDPTPAELATAWQYGAGGALSIISAPDSTMMADVVGYEAAANNNQEKMTVGEARGVFERRVSKVSVDSAPSESGDDPTVSYGPPNRPAYGWNRDRPEIYSAEASSLQTTAEGDVVHHPGPTDSGVYEDKQGNLWTNRVANAAEDARSVAFSDRRLDESYGNSLNRTGPRTRPRNWFVKLRTSEQERLSDRRTKRFGTGQPLPSEYFKPRAFDPFEDDHQRALEVAMMDPDPKRRKLRVAALESTVEAKRAAVRAGERGAKDEMEKLIRAGEVHSFSHLPKELRMRAGDRSSAIDEFNAIYEDVYGKTPEEMLNKIDPSSADDMSADDMSDEDKYQQYYDAIALFQDNPVKFREWVEERRNMFSKILPKGKGKEMLDLFESSKLFDISDYLSDEVYTEFAWWGVYDPGANRVARRDIDGGKPSEDILHDPESARRWLIASHGYATAIKFHMESNDGRKPTPEEQREIASRVGRALAHTDDRGSLIKSDPIMGDTISDYSEAEVAEARAAAAASGAQLSEPDLVRALVANKIRKVEQARLDRFREASE